MEIDRANSPIFITGIPRSGTSMIAGVLQICGLFFGQSPKPERQSARGMYENKSIHDRLVEPYLSGIEADSFCQFPLPRTSDLLIPVDWGTKVKAILQEEGYQSKERLWAYKSSKLAVMWPVWNFAFPNARWILVRRRSGDIISSCLSTMYMKAFKDKANLDKLGVKTEEDGWKWMIHEYEGRLRDMIESGLNCKVVWPDRMVSGDYSQLYETLDWIGLKWDTKVLMEALSYIDPKFWKPRRE